jgi:DNA-binding CsgD family transcriptional regulator
VEENLKEIAEKFNVSVETLEKYIAWMKERHKNGAQWYNTDE